MVTADDCKPVCPQCGADLLEIELPQRDICGNPVPGRLVCSANWDHYPIPDPGEKKRERIDLLRQGGLPPARPNPVARKWTAFEKKHFPDAHKPLTFSLTVSSVLAPCEATHRKWDRANAKNWIKARHGGLRESRWIGGTIGRDVSPSPPDLGDLYVEYFAEMQAMGLPARPWEAWKAHYESVNARKCQPTPPYANEEATGCH